ADKGNAGLDKAARDEKARAAQVSSITVADGIGLARQVKGITGFARTQQREGPFLELVEAVHCPRLAQRFELGADLRDERTGPVGSAVMSGTPSRAGTRGSPTGITGS